MLGLERPATGLAAGVCRSPGRGPAGPWAAVEPLHGLGVGWPRRRFHPAHGVVCAAQARTRHRNRNRVGADYLLVYRLPLPVSGIR